MVVVEVEVVERDDREPSRRVSDVLPEPDAPVSSTIRVGTSRDPGGRSNSAGSPAGPVGTGSVRVAASVGPPSASC